MTKAEKVVYDKRRYYQKRSKLLEQSKKYHQKRWICDSIFRERKKQYDQKWKKSKFGRQWCAAYAAKRRVNETGGLSFEERDKILNKFSYQCVRCKSTSRLEIDHFYPLSRGFSLTSDNAIVLCRKCNRQKYNKMPNEFFTLEELEKINEIQDQEL